MVSSSFHTENLWLAVSVIVHNASSENILLLDVFWQARHEVLSVFVQTFSLFGVFVCWIDDGGCLGGLRCSWLVLRPQMSIQLILIQASTYPHVRLTRRAGFRKLLLTKGRRGKSSHCWRAKLWARRRPQRRAY